MLFFFFLGRRIESFCVDVGVPFVEQIGILEPLFFAYVVLLERKAERQRVPERQILFGRLRAGHRRYRHRGGERQGEHQAAPDQTPA